MVPNKVLSILFVLMVIDGSMAGILDRLPGAGLLNSLSSSNSDEGAAAEWPSFVRIVDAKDLPSLLFFNMNGTNRHGSSESIWSNLFNLFGSDGSISDEMERENGAWFAIPGWSKAMLNGTGISHTILPGLLVPAKLEPDQMNEFTNRLNLFNNFSKNSPLGFLFNPGMNNNFNPFNIPFLPEKTGNPSTPAPLVPEKTQPLETADIKPATENKENVAETRKLGRKVMTFPSFMRSIRSALNIGNEENTEVKDGEKVVNIEEPVKETGIQMEPIPTSESTPESNSEAHKSNSEDTRTLGALGLIQPLFNLLSGSFGGSSKTLTNEPLDTLRPPSSSSSFNGQNGFNGLNGLNGLNGFNGQNGYNGQPNFIG